MQVLRLHIVPRLGRYEFKSPIEDLWIKGLEFRVLGLGIKGLRLGFRD